MKTLKELLKAKQEELFDGSRYVTQEFQDFGYRLAIKLDDLQHKALYIKLAKKENRALIETALSFAVDYPKAKNKAKVFMWKLKELKNAEQKSDQEKPV